jgi:hypothetical protein
MIIEASNILRLLLASFDDKLTWAFLVWLVRILARRILTEGMESGVFGS